MCKYYIIPCPLPPPDVFLCFPAHTKRNCFILFTFGIYSLISIYWYALYMQSICVSTRYTHVLLLPPDVLPHSLAHTWRNHSILWIFWSYSLRPIRWYAFYGRGACASTRFDHVLLLPPNVSSRISLYTPWNHLILCIFGVYSLRAF